jgi:hypothetical protein
VVRAHIRKGPEPTRCRPGAMRRMRSRAVLNSLVSTFVWGPKRTCTLTTRLNLPNVDWSSRPLPSARLSQMCRADLVWDTRCDRVDIRLACGNVQVSRPGRLAAEASRPSPSAVVSLGDDGRQWDGTGAGQGCAQSWWARGCPPRPPRRPHPGTSVPVPGGLGWAGGAGALPAESAGRPARCEGPPSPAEQEWTV